MDHTVQLVCSMEKCMCLEMTGGPQLVGSHLTSCRTQRFVSRNTNKVQLVIEFIIPEFIEGSSCFERHTAHHQEL